jgi:hypothetical protein
MLGLRVRLLAFAVMDPDQCIVEPSLVGVFIVILLGRVLLNLMACQVSILVRIKRILVEFIHLHPLYLVICRVNILKGVSLVSDR